MKDIKIWELNKPKSAAKSRLNRIVQKGVWCWTKCHDNTLNRRSFIANGIRRKGLMASEWETHPHIHRSNEKYITNIPSHIWIFIYIYEEKCGLNAFSPVVTENPTHLASIQPQLNARFKCRGSFNVLQWLPSWAERNKCDSKQKNK